MNLTDYLDAYANAKAVLRDAEMRGVKDTSFYEDMVVATRAEIDDYVAARWDAPICPSTIYVDSWGRAAVGARP